MTESMHALEHPLPAGMRDLLPEEARARRALARRLLGALEIHGYELVLLPAFEFAEVLERGLGALDSSDVLRFIEPESGEVAALRPDMTPQIARMIATRMRDRPPPFRLAYEGTVLRRKSGRARKRRQIPQVGVELAGASAPHGDLELLRVATAALHAAGLEDFVLDLGDAGIVRGLLRDVPSAAATAVAEAVGRKDEDEVMMRMKDAGSDPSRLLDVIRASLSSGSPANALADGLRIVAGTAAEEPAKRLRALYDAAAAAGLGAIVTVDLGEIRSAAYYTGMLLRAYAKGHGEAIASGGRYDELLGRFGAPIAAVGFAIDLDALASACSAAGFRRKSVDRVLVIADVAAVDALRTRGVVAIARDAIDGAVEYAKAWGFSHVLCGREVIEMESGTKTELGEVGLARFRAGEDSCPASSS